jgi:hypothetical protein
MQFEDVISAVSMDSPLEHYSYTFHLCRQQELAYRKV